MEEAILIGIFAIILGVITTALFILTNYAYYKFIKKEKDALRYAILFYFDSLESSLIFLAKLAIFIILFSLSGVVYLLWKG